MRFGVIPWPWWSLFCHHPPHCAMFYPSGLEKHVFAGVVLFTGVMVFAGAFAGVFAGVVVFSGEVYTVVQQVIN